MRRYNTSGVNGSVCPGSNTCVTGSVCAGIIPLLLNLCALGLIPVLQELYVVCMYNNYLNYL